MPALASRNWETLGKSLVISPSSGACHGAQERRRQLPLAGPRDVPVVPLSVSLYDLSYPSHPHQDVSATVPPFYR